VTSSGGGDDDEQALLERMAKREERRQKRMMEALEREKDQNPGNASNHGSGENSVDERSVGRRGRYQDNEEEVEERNCRKKEEEGKAAPEEEEAEQGEEEEEEEVEVVEEKPRRSYMREQVSLFLFHTFLSIFTSFSVSMFSFIKCTLFIHRNPLTRELETRYDHGYIDWWLEFADRLSDFDKNVTLPFLLMGRYRRTSGGFK
jgi:hypothetical protein